MASPIIKGSGEPQFQYWEQEFTPYQGIHTNQEFKGTNLPKISALAQAYYNQGYKGKLRYEHNVATLTVENTNGAIYGGSTSPAASALVDKWEVAVDQEKPELFENSNFLGYLTFYDGTYAGLSQQIIQCIRGVANSSSPKWSAFSDQLKAQNIQDVTGTDISPATKIYSVFSSKMSSIKYFVEDYLRGSTSFVRGKYTLKHTTIAPNTYSSNVSDFNVCNIYSIAGLLSECQSRSLWLMPLPSFLSYKISAYPVPATIPPNFYYGALKMRSPAVLAARGRIEITTEYLIDTWPIHTYGMAS